MKVRYLPSGLHLGPQTELPLAVIGIASPPEDETIHSRVSDWSFSRSWDRTV